jgi:hypothetical protein
MKEGEVNKIVTKINQIFEDYHISDFEKVQIFEVIKFDMYLDNIKKLLHK